MPITVTCSCGKKLTVGDGLAGKTLNCPKCGNGVFVSAAPQASSARPKKDVTPKVTVSPGTILFVSIGAILTICALTFYFGPMKVWNQWEALGSKAQDDVHSVVTFGLQAYLSEQGGYDPGKAHHTPTVEGDITFFRPTLAMSMPDRVPFLGKTNQGDFKGYYYPATGNVEADVDFGGQAFAGMVNLSKSTGQFHMTGRMKDGHAVAESGGKELKLVYRKTDDE